MYSEKKPPPDRRRLSIVSDDAYFFSRILPEAHSMKYFMFGPSV